MFLGLSYYFIIMDFLIYSFLGWIYESSFVSIRDQKPTNRGFLIGPFLPLYGFGGTLVYVFLRPLSHIPTLLFVGGMLLATFIEYLTSWGMEKLFHAQWWDYSEEPYNVRGRIALIPSMFWGILSLAAFDFLQPFVSWVIRLIPHTVGAIVMYSIGVIMIADLIYTCITTFNFRKQIENMYHFRDELLQQLSESQLGSLSEIITSSRTYSFYEDKKDAMLNKLAELRNSERFISSSASLSKLTELENRFKSYLDIHIAFQKKGRHFGNQRLLRAFPTMKFVPHGSRKFAKTHPMIRMKDLLIQLADKPRKKQD